jgi:hypothetical protein
LVCVQIGAIGASGEASQLQRISEWLHIVWRAFGAQLGAIGTLKTRVLTRLADSCLSKEAFGTLAETRLPLEIVVLVVADGTSGAVTQFANAGGAIACALCAHPLI